MGEVNAGDGGTFPSFAQMVLLVSGNSGTSRLSPDYPRPQIIPLWDFFQATSPRLFTPINPISPQHTASFFESYYETAQPDGLPTPYGPEYGDED